jgi:hypothetical protein
MKRISLMLALFLTLSFGAAYGGTSAVCDLDNAAGLFNVDTIGVGFPVTFNMRLTNDDQTNKVKGATNGFEIYSPDGATWTNVGYGPTSAGELLTTYGIEFDLVYSVNTFSWDGAGADTIGFGGSVMLGAGIPPSYDGVVYNITVNVADDAHDGKTLCIDSAYYPPSGTWAWAYGGAIGTFAPIWGGPYCYVIYDVPNLCPVFTAPVTNYTGDHCDLVSIDYDATDNEQDPITFSVVAGVGNIDGTTGQYTYQPTLGDVGASVTADILADDGFHGNPSSCTPITLNMNFTNQAPVFTGGCGDVLAIGKGNTGCITMSYDDVDCDPTTLSIVGTSPLPVGSVYLSGDDVCFDTDDLDGGIYYTTTVRVSDGVDYTDCEVYFDVLVTEPYEIQIEKTHNTLQGMHTIVDVTVNKGSEDMGGFDILIAYDASALHFQAAIPGDLHTICGWEYFDYRFGPFGNCGNQCPSGLLRVVGIAETNNGPNHPLCLMLTPPFVLFSLDFLVSNDRTLECMYVPIRFYWMDCGDNSIAYHPVDDPLASIQGVSRYVIDFDLIGHIEDMFTGFPTYTGVQWECLQNDQDKPVPIQFVDFLNGGVDIICADSIDDRGDINLNGTANEIADAVLFSNYFVKGISVFNVNYQGQVAATDVNADGLTLSVADLVYLIRIIVGDALPYPKIGAEAHAYHMDNGVMSVDTKMGAAFIVLEGDVAPRLLAENMEMDYAFNGRNTQVLIYQIGAEGFVGEFVAFDAPIVSVEMATYDGAPVAAKNVPTSYALHQNYPNPFNPKTTLAFALPTGGDYSLTIYNVTGQKVASFAGTAEAGIHSVDWDAADMASGVYFYKLDTDEFTDTKKMVLLK